MYIINSEALESVMCDVKIHEVSSSEMFQPCDLSIYISIKQSINLSLYICRECQAQEGSSHVTWPQLAPGHVMGGV